MRKAYQSEGTPFDSSILVCDPREQKNVTSDLALLLHCTAIGYRSYLAGESPLGTIGGGNGSEGKREDKV